MSELERRAERSRQAASVINNPNAAYDEITTLRQKLEQSEMRCAELRECVNKGLEVWGEYLTTGGGSPVAHGRFVKKAQRFNEQATRLSQQASDIESGS